MSRSAFALWVLIVCVMAVAVLGTVTRRQVAAHEELGRMEELEQRSARMEEELARVRQEVRNLGSRERVVREAELRLGMRIPSEAELVLLPATGGDRE